MPRKAKVPKAKQTVAKSKAKIRAEIKLESPQTEAPAPISTAKPTEEKPSTLDVLKKFVLYDKKYDKKYQTAQAKEPAKVSAKPKSKLEEHAENEIGTSDEAVTSDLTAQELLDKSPEELEAQLGKREANNLVRQMRIITAILLGKKKNKELAQVLDTDKSFTTKQIKQLEEQGLVKREGGGKEVTYEVDQFNVMKFLQSKVVIKWGSKTKAQPESKIEDKVKVEENNGKNGK